MPSLSQMSKATFLAEVDSGLIRYVGLPTAALPIADDTNYDELFNSGAAPAGDYWLCGIQVCVFACAADVSFEICLGIGGADGAAVVPPLLLLTQYPVIISAEGGALGSNYAHIHWLPYPVRVPGGTRMAARIDNTPTGTDVIDEFRAILATVVGQGA